MTARRDFNGVPGASIDDYEPTGRDRLDWLTPSITPRPGAARSIKALYPFSKHIRPAPLLAS